jgi:hypothetical protein
MAPSVVGNWEQKTLIFLFLVCCSPSPLTTAGFIAFLTVELTHKKQCCTAGKSACPTYTMHYSDVGSRDWKRTTGKSAIRTGSNQLPNQSGTSNLQRLAYNDKTGSSELRNKIIHYGS